MLPLETLSGGLFIMTVVQHTLKPYSNYFCGGLLFIVIVEWTPKPCSNY